MFVSIRVRPHAFRVAVLVVLLGIGTLARAEYLHHVSASGDPSLKPISRVDTPENRIAFTFDVTWGEVELGKILQVLRQQQVRATFFAGGSFMIEYPEKVRSIAAAGHEVGTLGQRIVDLSNLDEQEIRANLLGSQSLMQKAVGAPVRYFRPPQGSPTPTILKAAHAAQLRTVTFSVDSGDTYGSNPQQIVKRVLRHATKGDIIRFSASDFSPTTAKALPEIIRALQAKGFQLVTVSDLLPASAPLTNGGLHPGGVVPGGLVPGRSGAPVPGHRAP